MPQRVAVYFLFVAYTTLKNNVLICVTNATHYII